MLEPFKPPVYVGQGYFDVNRHGLRCYGFRRGPYGQANPMLWTLFYPVGSELLIVRATVDDFGDLVVVS